ncbi:hypothetical protein B1A75_11990 [Geobacillus sp. LEMMY01]|nr:hypothetical protein B1A75_11990 [Geobacillus sp. LEMMY01]
MFALGAEISYGGKEPHGGGSLALWGRRLIVVHFLREVGDFGDGQPGSLCCFRHQEHHSGRK